jgi:hypothetical protein
MNPTAPQQSTGALPAPRGALAERRSVRGTVAALSAVAAVGGRALNVLRLQSMAAVGDHIHLTYGTATDARTAAALLHLPASSHSRAIVGSGRTVHAWRGDVAELTLTVEGYGVLSEETPDRLVADVLAADSWAGPAPDLGPCPDDVHAALTHAADTGVVR